MASPLTASAPRTRNEKNLRLRPHPRRILIARLLVVLALIGATAGCRCIDSSGFRVVNRTFKPIILSVELEGDESQIQIIQSYPGSVENVIWDSPDKRCYYRFTTGPVPLPRLFFTAKNDYNEELWTAEAVGIPVRDPKSGIVNYLPTWNDYKAWQKAGRDEDPRVPASCRPVQSSSIYTLTIDDKGMEWVFGQ